MSNEFDIEQLRLGGNPIAGAIPKHKNKEHFLKGPVPLNWIAGAACCGGRALHVAIILWYRVGLEKKPTVKIPRWVADKFGLSRYSKTRGLRALEQAGLVSVIRRQGCSPLVTLLDGRGKE
jgi:DNA-binding transcriptional ArsR family regulator|tara:strand:- start:346 stop:708 length:363 start_codon:yes stop_codon:yes gene_type:complete